MTSEKMTIEQAVRSFQTDSANLEQLRDLAARIGDEAYSEGAPVLLQLLQHEDAIVRYHAAVSLGFELKVKPATETFISMLLEDEDEDCRDAAAGSLRVLWKNSNDFRLLKILSQVALEDQDEHLRRSAYFALIAIHGIAPEEDLQILTQGRPPVDSDRISRILRETT
jgi:HEAT repeat protein